VFAGKPRGSHEAGEISLLFAEIPKSASGLEDDGYAVNTQKKEQYGFC